MKKEIKELFDEDLDLSSEEKAVVLMFLIMLLCFIFMIVGIIVWGIGNIIILVFGINATWKFWQGLLIGIVLCLIKMIL